MIRVQKAGNDDPVMVHEAVGVFNNADDLQAAMDDLQSHGFMRHELSVLADQEKIKSKLGRKYRDVRELEDDPSAPRASFLPNETVGEIEGAFIAIPMYLAVIASTWIVVAEGGTLAHAVIAAIVAGAMGATIGVMMARGFAEQRDRDLREKIHKGGLPLWVNLRAPEQENTATSIMKKHAARDVHVHDIPLYG
ncbi:hypothetical protein [Micavibrio aeruginosavorus]|uniref:Uncharacterized protein n=1 Tax=Micavibrio aeruginosavorus EPB TaxID=349215 RepID=M4VV86_9BACT|nr:hypothetical protein [Micavibrio aeruginosavorus]AGH97109.1 hypothetical protein A11S_274 [Micavibrio aeruginosavorus EPB]